MVAVDSHPCLILISRLLIVIRLGVVTRYRHLCRSNIRLRGSTVIACYLVAALAAGLSLLRRTGPVLAGVAYPYIYSALLWRSMESGYVTGAGLGGIFSDSYGHSNGSSFTLGSMPYSTTQCYLGNFDGSGRTGIACPSAGKIIYTFSNGSGYGSPVTQTTSIPSTSIGSDAGYSAPPTGTNNYPKNACLVRDVVGDGTDDLVCGGAGGPLTGQYPPSYPDHTLTSTVWGGWLSTGNGFTYSEWTSPGYAYSYTCLQGEFNGDGLQDLACHYGTGQTWTILLSTGRGWVAQTWGNGPTTSLTGLNTCNNAYKCNGLTNTTTLNGIDCLSGDLTVMD